MVPGPQDDLDAAGRRGEHHGVLQEFGEHEGQIADDVGDDGDIALGVRSHPLEALDLAERGTDDVAEPHRFGVQTGLADPREQHETVGVALETDGDVVDAVEPVQHLGVGLAALHRVDQGELAGRQVADPAADVAEHLGDVALG